MIAMAGNPNYVKVELSDEDPSVTIHTLMAEQIQMDAESLLKEAQDSWIEAFDKSNDSAKDHIRTIAEAVSELNKSGITTYPQE